MVSESSRSTRGGLWLHLGKNKEQESRLAGAAIAPEPPAGINRGSDRALGSESVQEFNSRLVSAAHILVPSFTADSTNSF